MGYSTHFFAPKKISTAREPGYAKIGMSSNLVDLYIYSTQFLAPETISTAREPGYTKIGVSSKLVDLVISGRFCRL